MARKRERSALCERHRVHCDPRNVASAAAPRWLWFQHLATRRADKRSPAGSPCDAQIWRLERYERAGSPAASLAVRASSRAGERLL